MAAFLGGEAAAREAQVARINQELRDAFEVGKRAGAAEERTRCLDICAAVKPCASGVEMRTTIRAEIAAGSASARRCVRVACRPAISPCNTAVRARATRRSPASRVPAAASIDAIPW